MKENSRELRKIDNNNYKLIMNDEENRWYQEKFYTKSELKENYEILKIQRDQLKIGNVAAKKKLKDNFIKLTPEIEATLKLITKAVKYQDFEKAKDDLDKQEKDFNMLNNQCKEIEVAIPELLRNK